MLKVLFIEGSVKRMNEYKEEKRKKGNFIGTIMKYRFAGKILGIVIMIAVVAIISVGIKKVYFTDSKTTKLGFYDIGRLVTQEAYCTEVNVTDKSQELFGVKIPFTQTKYIYSYDVVVKAAVDFEKIDWNLKGKTINVTVPKAEVDSCDVNTDSLKVYHEADSIFTKIDLDDRNTALKQLKKQAVDDAVENGLLDRADSNAQTIIKAFFSKEFDMKEYEIKFTVK